MSLNTCTISGNLTRDAEYKQAGGTEILNFCVAVNERRKNGKTGEWEDYANFVDCVLFGKRANSLSRYLYRGTKVSVTGKIRQDRWETDGQKRSAIKVLVDDLEFMSRSEKPKQEDVDEDYSEDDLPF